MTEQITWVLEEGREFESEFFTEEELTEKQQENIWLKRFGEIFRDNPFAEDDYQYCYYECKTLEELKQVFLYGNWAIRQCFTYKNLAFINQVNAGDEWWTVKKFEDGRLLSFESVTFQAVIQHGEGYFEDYINQMLKATYEQCRKLEYTDKEFEDKWNK